MAGGVALNCVGNGVILREGPFEKLWIQPAAGDAGGSLGAALALWHIDQNNPRKVDRNDSMQGSYLGPIYSQKEIEEHLDKVGAKYQIFKDEELLDKTATDLSKEEAIGWFQGRMEFGARALGNRSILANPRDPQMKSRLNMMIKKREGFRPFAPIVKESLSSTYFDYTDLVPYMNQVVKVKKEFVDKLPAITHIDNSARIQSLDSKDNPRIYSLLTQLEIDNEYPIVINTSFNLKDQTMVLTPEDAIKTFLDCEMDTLVLGNYIIRKTII